MTNFLRWTGRIAGVIGLLLCAGSVLARVSDRFFIGGFQVGTLLQAGIAAMVLACLAYVAILAEGMRA